jgi:VanZ family protein
MALVFVVSSFEVSVPGVRHLPFRDKAIHFVEFGVLGWLCAGAASRSWQSESAWRTAAFAVFVSTLWGLSDEIHQALVPGRSSELADLAADFLGSVVGACAWHLFSNRSVRQYTGKFTSTE